MIKYYDNGAGATYIVSDCGIIRCDFEKENRVLFLSNLMVNENSRKRGEGRRLVEEAISLARSLGCDAVSLQVVRKTQWLVNWYERIGFSIVSYGFEEGLVIMSKLI